jgi:hypothetical protein
MLRGIRERGERDAKEEEVIVLEHPEVREPTDMKVGELVGRLSDDTARLVRDEIRLARAEMSQKAKAAGVGAGLLGGAGASVFYGFGVLIAAAIVGLAMVVALWAAILIVGAGLFIMAAVMAGAGKRKLNVAEPPVPTEALESTKRELDEFKRSVHA